MCNLGAIHVYGRYSIEMSFSTGISLSTRSMSIYSSKSAAWIFKESEWCDGIIVSTYARSVFLNGFMHWLEFPQIVAIDMDGKTRTKIQKPRGDAISIHEAQG